VRPRNTSSDIRRRFGATVVVVELFDCVTSPYNPVFERYRKSIAIMMQKVDYKSHMQMLFHSAPSSFPIIRRDCRLLACMAAMWLGQSSIAKAQAVQAAGANAATLPRMVDPSIDDTGEPFSYASRSTDQLSVMYAPSGAEITPEGDLYTGFGELDFYVGVDRMPVRQRIRTLKDGYLPVISYTVAHDGLRYRFTFFAASVGPSPKPAETGDEIIVNFVRVTVENPGSETRDAFLTTSWRYQGEQTTTFDTGDNRFRRPIKAGAVGAFHQPGDAFNPASTYTVQQNAFLRDGKAVYLFPSEPMPQLTASYRDYYNRSEPIDAPALVQPSTPMATAEYRIAVPGHSARSLDFKVPLLPTAATDGAYQAISQAKFDEREHSLEAFWQTTLARGMDIQTPEAKVNDTYRTSLINDLVALNKVGNDYVQTINQFQYHRFYMRDSADFVRMYDTSGYPDIARKVVDFFATRQQADGNFLSQPGQYDAWGEALWTYGEHYRMTHDKAFAATVYPRIQHAIVWLEAALAADPLHIMPATDVRDNEYIAGHLTGYNFLALDGLQAAERIAHDLDHTGDEAHYKTIEANLRNNFMKQLDRATAKTGGYMPPALDGDLGGADWGNLLSVVPEPQMPATDSRVTATLRSTQAHYEEGLITYRQPDQGTYLHHYLTIKNTLTELVRGEQQQAIREFYAELLHTSSTHTGWEYSIRPWGDRDFSGNLAPHGWFAADFRNLLRNMMLREEGSELHLLSALSPEWIGANRSIHVDRAATYFGGYGFDLVMPTDSTANLILRPAYDTGFSPQKVILHLPWFVQLTVLTVDGRSTAVPVSNVLELAPDTRLVRMQWKLLPIAKDIPADYDDAVARYKREYARRFLERNEGAAP
jgi:hypothetical protein